MKLYKKKSILKRYRNIYDLYLLFGIKILYFFKNNIILNKYYL